jgi:hypothetical protein
MSARKPPFGYEDEKQLANVLATGAKLGPSEAGF